MKSGRIPYPRLSKLWKVTNIFLVWLEILKTDRILSPLIAHLKDLIVKGKIKKATLGRGNIETTITRKAANWGEIEFKRWCDEKRKKAKNSKESERYDTGKINHPMCRGKF